MCYPRCIFCLSVLYTGILTVFLHHVPGVPPQLYIHVLCTYTILYVYFLSLFCIQGFWLYSFIMYLGFPLSYNGHEYTKVFDLISWIISAVPYIAIPAAAMHSCGLFEGTCKEVSYWVIDGDRLSHLFK